ncbi:MAG: sigma 54-interacting transcriptional regulator [Ferruginibacter sp.]
MNRKILIVEDEMIVATDLRMLLEKNKYIVTGIARSYEKAVEFIEKEKPDMVLLDIFLTGKLTGIDLAKKLKEKGIAFVYLSANANEDVLSAAKKTEPCGFIVKPFREKDLLVTIEIARYRHENRIESSYKIEEDLQSHLEIFFAKSSSWEEKLLQTATSLQVHIPFDFWSAGFNDMGERSLNNHSFLRIGFSEYQSIGMRELVTISGVTMDKLISMMSKERKETSCVTYNDEAFEMEVKTSTLKKLFADTFQMKSLLILPLQFPGKPLFNFYFFSKMPDAYKPRHIHLLNHLRYTLSGLIENGLENKKNELITGKINIKSDKGNEISCFEKIIGKSHLLLNVFDQVMQVAPMDTSVLILGESGTGKESIADAIHECSPRKTKPFVKINCATLPSTLIESELFGHEKGSFTGALEKRIGKFEQANEGTIFLDEIGEMSLDMQVKLLRVLQEQEIERIGGKAPIKINVRIVAATNRNLEKEVAEGRFRLDLYYRLNVFPITLPPLRERKEDITLLTDHFINYFNRKTGKKITGVSSKVYQLLLNYTWPGNIRELQHLIERSVLMAKGNIIEEISIPDIFRTSITDRPEKTQSKSIHENEKDYILSVLKRSNGKIWGMGGAAELLKIPPTTLASKMKKLGIKKDFND